MLKHYKCILKKILTTRYYKKRIEKTNNWQSLGIKTLKNETERKSMNK